MNNISTLGLLLTVIVFIGCASHDASLPGTGDFKHIMAIEIENDSDSLHLNIVTNQLLNYTEDRIANPKGIVFSFNDTKIDGSKGLYTPEENDVIRYVRAGAHAVNGSPVATIYIALKVDTTYQVLRDHKRLQFTFPIKPALSKNHAPQEKPVEIKLDSQQVQKLLPKASVLVKVNTESYEDTLAVDVVADGTIKRYNTFTLDNPPRIVFDFFNINSPHSVEQKIKVQSKVARQIRYSGHPDKLRLVIDTQKEYLSKYSSVSTDTGVTIKIGKLPE